MKPLFSFTIVLFFVFIFSCKNPDETPDKPFIKSVSFVGISAENVSLDAANSRITVNLPAVLKGGLRPVVELSEGASIVDGIMPEKTMDLTSLCGCSSDPKQITLRLENQGVSAIYKVMVVPGGPLGAQQADVPIHFTRNGDWVELSLPVENLYTSPKVTILSFTNLKTGRHEFVSADGACLNRCSGTEPDRILFALTNPIQSILKPGNSYKVAFNNIDFPQPLIIPD
ncbi:MAG TPA: hypothetical protein VGN64_23390 [Dyadobacter sp.]|jgi:hypothetical protein|nr:hypothetical protein [Dyadobacter sp.]